jgi:hypothetical protein
MTGEKTPPAGATVVEFKLAGETCDRWFNAEDVLHASAPPKAKQAIEAYVKAVARFLPDRRYVEYLCNVRPWGPENDEIKLHAFPELNVGNLIKKRNPCIKIVPNQVTAKVDELKKHARLQPS